MEILRRGDVRLSEQPPSGLHALFAYCISSGHPAAPMQGRRVHLIGIVLALSRDNEHVDQSTVPDHRQREEALAKGCAQA
jgi:hypothetical protein